MHERLTGLGFKVYLDDNEIRGGDHIGKKLTTAIRVSSIFLPILSPEFTTEAGELWCQPELDFTKAAGSCKFLPVVIKGVEIPDHILLTIGPQIKHLEYDPSNQSTGIANIIRAVETLLMEQPGIKLALSHWSTYIVPCPKGVTCNNNQVDCHTYCLALPCYSSTCVSFWRGCTL